MYKNNQLWNRCFLRSQRISYRYRETPRCPSIYIIDLNKLSLLFLFTITRQKLFFIFTKLFFFFFKLYFLWIYPAPCGSTSVLREIYCYDLLHLGVSKQFWRRCRGVTVDLEAIFFWEQSIASGNSSIGNFVPFFPLFCFYFSICFYLIVHSFLHEHLG